MEWLQSLLDRGSIPVLTAFCLVGRLPYRQRRISRQSAFIGKNIENRQRRFFNGLLYTFGRAVAYTALGIVLLVVLQSGSSLFGIQKFVGKYGEMPLGPALLLVGVCMLVGNRLDLPKFGFKGNGDGFGHQGFPFLNIVRGIASIRRGNPLENSQRGADCRAPCQPYDGLNRGPAGFMSPRQPYTHTPGPGEFSVSSVASGSKFPVFRFR